MQNQMYVAVIGLIGIVVILLLSLKLCSTDPGPIPLLEDPCLKETAVRVMYPVERWLAENNFFQQEHSQQVYQCLLDHLVISWEEDDFSCEYLQTMTDGWTLATVMGSLNKRSIQNDIAICISNEIGMQREKVITVLNLINGVIHKSRQLSSIGYYL